MNTVTGTRVKPVSSFQKLLDSFLDLLLPRKRHSRCFSFRFDYLRLLCTLPKCITLSRSVSRSVFPSIFFNFSGYHAITRKPCQSSWDELSYISPPTYLLFVISIFKRLFFSHLDFRQFQVTCQIFDYNLAK